jgi:hypothetical protein
MARLIFLPFFLDEQSNHHAADISAAAAFSCLLDFRQAAAAEAAAAAAAAVATGATATTRERPGRHIHDDASTSTLLSESPTGRRAAPLQYVCHALDTSVPASPRRATRGPGWP